MQPRVPIKVSSIPKPYTMNSKRALTIDPIEPFKGTLEKNHP